MYDDAKHTEESFRTKLKYCFSNLVTRKGWKYIGVWERSPEKKRLHFHGIFYIPDESMLNLTPYRDYNVREHRMQTTFQDPYFQKNFGRCDFERIDDKYEMGSMIQYLVKYIEKSGEKLVYSKGLPQYFISDILDEDVAGRIGAEDKKLLLFDDFTCYDQGMLVGKVSADTISKLRKSN